MLTRNNFAGRISSILYVEDSLSQSQRLKLCLEEKAGCHVHVALTGEEGLEIAHSTPIDLIVLDVELPGINGFEVCHRLKADEATANIPVIILTIRDQVDDALQGMMEGAIDYIAKDSFAERVLLETIKHINKK